jgi:hypothetical protein
MANLACLMVLQYYTPNSRFHIPMKVKLKVKYGFVLQDPSSFYFGIITSYLKMSGMPCYPYKCNTFLFLSMCFLILTAFLMRWYKSSGRSGAKPLMSSKRMNK